MSFIRYCILVSFQSLSNMRGLLLGLDIEGLGLVHFNFFLSHFLFECGHFTRPLGILLFLALYFPLQFPPYTQLHRWVWMDIIRCQNRTKLWLHFNTCLSNSFCFSLIRSAVFLILCSLWQRLNSCSVRRPSSYTKHTHSHTHYQAYLSNGGGTISRKL